MWRGGSVFTAFTAGLPVGLFFGAFGFVESGSMAALIALVVLSPVVFGIPMARRMARFWPGAKKLHGTERAAVVRASRRGESIRDSRLAQAVIDYSSGLHAAREQARRYRWVVPAVAAVSLILAITDSFFGPIRLALVSWLWVAFVLVESWWWPRKEASLLSIAGRAETLARQTVAGG